MFLWFRSDRVQMATFSPLKVIDVFLAPTGRSSFSPLSSSSSLSFPGLPSRSTAFLLLSGVFWETESISVVTELVSEERVWRCWKNSQNSSCRSGLCLRRFDIWEKRQRTNRNEWVYFYSDVSHTDLSLSDRTESYRIQNPAADSPHWNISVYVCGLYNLSEVIFYLLHVLRWRGGASLQHWHHLLVEGGAFS